MRTLNYKETYRELLTPEIVSYLAQIHEQKGQQNLFIEAHKDALTELLEIAKIQSTEASNRIEGIITTDDRLKKIVRNKTAPRNRNEREIAGYRDVLATIHENYDFIPVRPNMILQLHRDLYKFNNPGFGGNYKNSDNIIAEELPDGTKLVRFQPVPAWETPEAIETLCNTFNDAVNDPDMDPLLLMKQRGYRGGYSGITIFSSKIMCGQCGGWYGSKVWHSTDKYRRIIWQCNAKFKEKKHCRTPHLTEDEIKAAFVRVMDKLTTDRAMILEELREDQAMLTGTEDLEKEQKRLAEQMNVDADAVQEAIAENARVAQNQEEYSIRYEALSARFQETKDKYDAVTAEIAQRGIRRREFGRFIHSLEALPEMVTEFSEELWGSLVDHVTVHSKDNIVFTLTSGMEIKA